MFIRFNVSNFLSIYEKQEFTQLAGSARGKNNLIYQSKNLKLLKYSSIYGANASGKSNLIKAISFSKECITKGIKNSRSSEKYCKLSKKYRNEESYFDFEILINNHTYSYGFNALLSDSSVTGEWLYKLNPDLEDECIFERDLKNQSYNYDKKLFSEINNNKFNVWIEDSMQQNNSLLCTEIYNKKNIDPEFNIFNDLYNWFDHKLLILYPNTRFGSIDDIIQNDSTLLKILDSLDTGIRAISQKEVDFAKLPAEMQDSKFIDFINENLKKSKDKKVVLSNSNFLYEVKLNQYQKLSFRKIVFKHTDDEESEYLDFYEESDGTKRIIELIQAIELALRQNITLIVDEIERSLHPLLIESILDYYLNSISKTNSQLIITTHDYRLLELDGIRKDCIWFVEKDYSGVTSFKSLDEYVIRNDLKLSKAYIEGRFGAIPMLGNMKPNNMDANCED